MKNSVLVLLLSACLAGFGQSNTAILDSVMVFVPAGEFSMGSADGRSDAKPVHTVRLRDFYIGKYEVTQAVWRWVMGSDAGSQSDCPNCPVYNVSYAGVDSFLAILNQRSGKQYRLPTEAEWEFAASGGHSGKGFLYCGSNDLEEIAWYEPNAGMKTHPVGLKKPNELGLYDMSGNVWEMCADWYGKSYYKHSPADNPVNLTPSSHHVLRGGSWRSREQRCQSRARNRDIHDHTISNCGFRLVLQQ